MKKQKILSFALCAAVITAGLTGCSSDVSRDVSAVIGSGESDYPNAHLIVMTENAATLDGVSVEEYDYTWHCDPSKPHDEVKNAPAEYYTGTKPDTDSAVYIDSELFYFPSLPESGFKKVNYDGETEWAYYYTDGENDDYIFATLPDLASSLPTQMMHTEEEASQNRVLHITKPGEYILEGKWNGQIFIDLGDEDATFADETAKVTLILNGADINCTVAPGIIFYSAYECDNTWESEETHGVDIDTSDAGAVLIIADDSENTVSGTNVFRMLKTKYKDETSQNSVKVQKKQRKTDAALYSYVTMNICGNTGKLTVNSGFEGIDTELHLDFKGGNITVNSQDDGVNVNEDNVSVVIFDGADITINAALGAEGDGVDSNGYVVINGGTVSVNGITAPDSALDSEDGIYYNGGKIIVDGKEQTYEKGSVFRETGGIGGEFDGPDMGGRPDMPDMGGRPDMPDMGERPDFAGRPDMPENGGFQKPDAMPSPPNGDMEQGERPEYPLLPNGDNEKV